MKNNIIPWALVAINASALFYASSQPVEKSRETSIAVTKAIVQTIEEVYPEIQNQINLNQVHRNVRKSSHFVLYMMLGYLVANAMKKKGHEKIAYSLLICVLISMMDETYQLFVPGRGGSVTDVMIDTLGATTGIALNTIKNKDSTPEKCKIKKTIKKPIDNPIKSAIIK